MLLHHYFKETILLPLTIILTGAVILLITILYMKNQQKIDAKIQSLMPKFILKLQPKNRLIKK